MNNELETLGLSLLECIPYNNQVDISTSSNITLTFNSDLDTSSVVGNILILEDSKLLFINEDNLKNINYFQTVETNISYNDKVLTLKPKNKLKPNTRYIIALKKGNIKNITGKGLYKTYVSSFFTSNIETGETINIVVPEHGSILEDMPEICWDHTNSEAIILQIAKDNEFKFVIYENIIRRIKDDTIDSIKPNGDYDEGLYYARIKTINGDWGETIQFFIKKNIKEKAKITDDDIVEDTIEIEEEEFSNELLILDTFPKPNSTMVSDKTNIIYVKVMGEISLSDIDLNRSFVYGGLFEEEDEEKLTAQEYVSGKWCVVYDEFEDASYIIFTPDIITDEIISYTVTFCDYDGTILKEQIVEEGSSAESPEENPTREHYTFLKWDTNYENINEDLTVTAIYEEDIKYTVIFYDYDKETVLSEQQVYVGEAAIEPEQPIREGYTFIGWDDTFTSINKNMVIVAQYEKQ